MPPTFPAGPVTLMAVSLTPVTVAVPVAWGLPPPPLKVTLYVAPAVQVRRRVCVKLTDRAFSVTPAATTVAVVPPAGAGAIVTAGLDVYPLPAAVTLMALTFIVADAVAPLPLPLVDVRVTVGTLVYP